MLVAFVLAQVVADAPPIEEARLPAGTAIELMVLTEVSADRARAGDVVKLMLNKPIVRDGRTLVAAGAHAYGEVVSVGKSGPALKAGALQVRLRRLVVDGQNLPIDGSVEQKGHGGKSDDAVKVVLVPLYALFAPGNSGKLKAGDLVAAFLTHAYSYGVREPGLPKLREVEDGALIAH
jgi:hypothetical protein